MRYFTRALLGLLIILFLTAYALFLGYGYLNKKEFAESPKQHLVQAKLGILEIAGLQKAQGRLALSAKDPVAIDSLKMISGMLGLSTEKLTGQLEEVQMALPDGQSYGFSGFMVTTIKSVLSMFISLPFIVLLLILIIVSGFISREQFNSFISLFKSVEAFGAKVELKDFTAKDKADLEGTIVSYQGMVMAKYDIWQQRRNIRGIFEKIAEDLKTDIFSKFKIPPDDVRFTLHVPDLLFKNRLYQLIDYWPRGTGRGRTFSTRYGIIGRTWRLEEDLLTNVPANPRDLMEGWGMTREESENKDKSAFGSIVLKNDNNVCVGVIFMDSKKLDIFGAQGQKALQDDFCKVAKEKSKFLVKELEVIKDQLMDQFLLLDF